MSNGSSESSEESCPRQARRHDRGSGAGLACWLVLVAGCHHTVLQHNADLQFELAAVSSEELFVLGVVHARSGDLLRAEQYLNAARQLGQDESAVVYWLVRVCVAAGRYQSALSHAADYLRAHPSDWSLRFVVASIHEALGDVARARSELERIVAAQPDRPLPRYRLAMLYRTRQGDQERARAQLEAYLRLSPKGPHAPEVIAALRETDGVSLGPQLVPHPAKTVVRAKEVP